MFATKREYDCMQCTYPTPHECQKTAGILLTSEFYSQTPDGGVTENIMHVVHCLLVYSNGKQHNHLSDAIK
jgi:hypothetical protein